MHERFLQFLALAACLGLLPASAYAKGGPPAGKGKGASEHGANDKDRHHDDDNDRDEHHAGRDHDHDRDHDREAAGPSSRPKGWSEGKKTGWGDCNVPPGLAKKRGCDSSGFSAREREAHRHSVATTHHTTSTVTPARTTSSHPVTTARTTTTHPTTTTTHPITTSSQTRSRAVTDAETRRKEGVK